MPKAKPAKEQRISLLRTSWECWFLVSKEEGKAQVKTQASKVHLQSHTIFFPTEATKTNYREIDFSQSFVVPALHPEPHERMAKDTCLPQSGGGSCTRLWVPHKGIGLTPQGSPSIRTRSCAVPSLPHPSQITQPRSLLRSSAPHAGYPVLGPGPRSVWLQSLGRLHTACLNKSTSPRKSARNQHLKRTAAVSRHAAISWRGCCITSWRMSSPTTPLYQKSRAQPYLCCPKEAP